ncbi:MAG TPA: protease modulator HflC [Hyphomonadaceae bacterium]|jgi:membrane protease subunit HflC|nr:protease modulator HflC [Hyphomonadaceae bacterium]
MQRTLIIAGVLAAAVLILLANSFFIVPVERQAIVLRFGQAQYVVNSDTSPGKAGLYLKAPFVENVITYDRRNLGFDLEPKEIIAADQQRLIVDAIARWRIKDPLQFFRSAQTEDNGRSQLQTYMTSTLQGELGKVNQPDIISGQRVSVMQRIRSELQINMQQFGVEIVDVRIRQADLPKENSDRVYERMKSQLRQKVNQYQAEGEQIFKTKVGEADKEVAVILGDARQLSERTRGEGDAERNKIYAAAYNKDAEFFSFYRSLIAYETAIKAGTPMVISPDSDFFRYFGDQNGRR